MGKDTDSEHDPDIRKRIVDAISKFKRDKQSPDAKRIIETVSSCHTASAELIEEQLTLAVAQGIIDKRVDNGSCTYRLVVKSSPRKQHNNHEVNNFESDCLTVKKDTDLLPIVTAAIVGLQENNGSTLKSIERFITKNYSIACADGVELGCQIRDTAKKAVVNGKLRHAGRYYRIALSDSDTGDVNKNVSINNDDTKEDSSSRRNSATISDDTPVTNCNTTGIASNSATPNGPNSKARSDTPTGEDWYYEVVVCDTDKKVLLLTVLPCDAVCDKVHCDKDWT